MLSKSTIKYINSLKIKKYRQQHRKFTAEGDKIVKEMLQNSKISLDVICCTQQWADDNSPLLRKYNAITIIVTTNELKKISSLQTPNHVLVVLSYIENTINQEHIENNLSLVLDTIQDPGNLGTILRIADWFGIPHVFCSENCVDVYNSKVVQASMGAFLRVKIEYTDLSLLFEKNKNLPIYGAVLGGENLFQTKLSKNGFIIIGNESKGIAKNIMPYLSHKIEIPRYGGAESLNAAVATGIICSFFKNVTL